MLLNRSILIKVFACRFNGSKCAIHEPNYFSQGNLVGAPGKFITAIRTFLPTVLVNRFIILIPRENDVIVNQDVSSGFNQQNKC